MFQLSVMLITYVMQIISIWFDDNGEERVVEIDDGFNTLSNETKTEDNLVAEGVIPSGIKPFITPHIYLINQIMNEQIVAFLHHRLKTSMSQEYLTMSLIVDQIMKVAVKIDLNSEVQ